MGFENFPPKNTGDQPIEKPKTAGKVDFIAMAENLNPDIGKLEYELAQVVKRIASIKRQMPNYVGKLTDLSDAEAERELLKKQIEAHPDFGSRRQGIERNLTGRDDRINKWN